MPIIKQDPAHFSAVVKALSGFEFASVEKRVDQECYI